MHDEKNKSLTTTEENYSTPPAIHSTETNSTSEVKIDEQKDEGFFHVRTRTKWIIPIALLIFLLSAALIYAAVEAGLEVEIWQGAIWVLCAILSLYAIFKRSIAAIIFDVILFFGVSLIPAWQMGYEFFRPVIEKIFGQRRASFMTILSTTSAPARPVLKLKSASASSMKISSKSSVE